ncbi:hypothetical protein G6M85_03045 [Agrobacterium tumefaciens]|jgi:hypothetical protein|uniref:hypothetical protein n=1 Tax=Agrobacterium tumefaciens TaxID=358 RepID=UPI000DCF8C6A|nr:hypothetical protein [Agrobacterium tumefaciens]NTE64586.1 hypothetical protein [Agrobacterium tumefaciens]
MAITLHPDCSFSKSFDELNPAEKKWAEHEIQKVASQLTGSKWSNDHLEYLKFILSKELEGRPAPTRVKPHGLERKKTPEQTLSDIFKQIK